MQWGVALLVLRVHICTFLDQKIANVVTTMLSSYRQQSVPSEVRDVAPQHVTLDVGLHDLDLIELDRVEDLVPLPLLDAIFVGFLFSLLRLRRLSVQEVLRNLWLDHLVL